MGRRYVLFDIHLIPPFCSSNFIKLTLPPTHYKKKQPLYIVGNKYTIADICIFSWVNWAEWAGISLEPYPHVKAWLQNIQERPAVEKGVNVPEKFEMKEAMKTKEGEEEYAKHHSNWVIAGQNEDAKRHQ